MREYQKYEFCESVKCKALAYSLSNTPQCGRYSDTCIKTAKQFHQWLVDNGFKIVKDESECSGCEHYGGLITDCLVPSLTPCPKDEPFMSDVLVPWCEFGKDE